MCYSLTERLSVQKSHNCHVELSIRCSSNKLLSYCPYFMDGGAYMYKVVSSSRQEGRANASWATIFCRDLKIALVLVL